MIAQKMITEVTSGNRRLCFKKPLTLKIFVANDDPNYQEARIPFLEECDLVYGLSQSEVLADFRDTIFFLWDCYALDNRSWLTKKAKALKEMLLEMLEEKAIDELV